jgi:hypothetical protein
MATWKRLTQDPSTAAIDVNMDSVATIVREGGRNYTKLTFIFASGADQNPYAVTVKESPDDIRKLEALSSED